MTAERPALDVGLARGIAAIRWLTLGWAWTGLVFEREHLSEPGLAIATLMLATGLTAWVSLALATGQETLRGSFVAVELAVASTALVLDGVVYEAARSQSLPWAWPAAGIIAAAVAWGWRAGFAAALLVSLASFAGEGLLRDGWQWSGSVASKSALFVLAGLAAGSVTRRLRDAEAAISLARAREDVARVLHDGVLQTLAVIQRRSSDEHLRRMAAEQEADLRSFLRGDQTPAGDLATALEAAVALVSRRHAIDISLAIAPDVAALSPPAVDALAGAVAEALTNAAKHADADHVGVFAEPDEDDDAVVACVVRDNGTGFDPSAVTNGRGLDRSIRNRLAEVGGRAEVRSALGRGTEVHLWVS